MTQTKRIILNTIASYGRSLFALICGLITGRWTLLSLGQTDYGLIGVIGGLMAFIAFFNSWLASAIARFYALSEGMCRKTPKRGLEQCRQWFSIALIIHSLVPILLIIVGYPLGIWAIQHWLVIPLERVEACIWVFRFTCISGFVSMVNVPFTALYTAKQYIAELTIYSVVSTALNVCFVSYMITHPGMWLTKYALWTCGISIVPQLIIMIRAWKVFPECRFNIRYCMRKAPFVELFSYAGWQLWGFIGWLVRQQGINLLVNKYFGPRVNAAMAIGSSVNGHTTTLSSALMGAFTPAITTAYGTGDYTTVRNMVYRTSKFGLLLSLIFILPLFTELPYVITLWLKTPPPYTIGLCYLLIIAIFIDTATSGHGTAINATGKIAGFQTAICIVSLLTLPIAWLLVAQGHNVYAVGATMIFIACIHACVRLWYARKLVGIGVFKWVFQIILPMASVAVISEGIGFLPHLLLPPSFARLSIAAFLAELVLLPCVWFFLLDNEEKSFVMTKIWPLTNKLRRN